MCAYPSGNLGQTSSWWLRSSEVEQDSQREDVFSISFGTGCFSQNKDDNSDPLQSSTINFGDLTHSVDEFFGTDDTFSNMIGDPPTSGEMLKPDNCEGNCQSSQGGNGPSQMTNQLPPNGGYYLSQNAEDIYSSFNILLDGEVPNSVFDFAGTASPYLNTTSYLLTSGVDLQPGNSSSKEVMIVNPSADMHTLDTHQNCQNSNPSSSKNKAPRRKSTVFTINEVEALVQAVRRHGPGRWKMIKDEAFGNDSRRTHTDLRDKWRSLVKTANLPAHKRRGVVPPEELLEMVRYVDLNGMQIPPACHACSTMIQ